MRQVSWSRVLSLAVAGVVTSGVVACGETPQTAGAKKSDAKSSDGGTNTAFTVSGWKQGDPASWEQQMKARNQNQNEYQRTR